MAGVLVDVVLERLATLALDKVERELKLVRGVKQEIKNLTKKLIAIREVLEDAEQRQVMEASVKLWVDELNDVSFDMDDVLDEWITRVEKHQLEKQPTEGANAVVATKKKKVCFPFPPSCFRFGQVDYQLFLRREIALKIEELNERLALIDERKQSFGFQNIPRAVPPELSQRRKTTSLPNVKTFGRDDEKNLIISKLLSVSNEGKKVPLIIPMVGMGGMGKTSLANLVYNDDKIKSYFDKSIWVCVSDPFEEIKIAKAIIEVLDQENTSKNSDELETLMQGIFELIKGKKFLLVLDDVWSPKSHQWEELVKPLSNGATGSRVLVTTRNENVATLMKATNQMILLKELGEPFCLSLFYYHAEVDESSVSKEFSDIGSEIVKRCNGLPLAAKTLGSLMQNKKKIHEWQAVLNSKTWELKEIEHDVFQPLLLSYRDLHPPIKRCLLYCLSFPKDYIYNKNTLIELWMSQDYLKVNGSKEREIIGQNYFDELVKRSFFQDVEVDLPEYGNIRCKIHDFVHDFLQYVTNNEYLNLDSKLKANSDEEVPYDKVHHLTSMAADTGYSMECILLNCKRLRTIRAIDVSHYSIDLIFQLIVELKSLRTLALCRVSEDIPYGIDVTLEIPKMIGGLIHLRYLDLSGNGELKELPSVMGSLYNLQTLKLVGCWGLEEIDVGRLINLRHLYVNKCSERVLIKGIEKLKHMQTLDWFPVVRCYDMDEGNKWEQLKDVNQLQGSLSIYMKQNTKMAKNAAVMVNKSRLLELKLEFYWNVDEEREVMNGLEPHPCLESLSIDGYGGDAFSDWFSSLHCLRVLSLIGCRHCKILPPLGKLASLESLHIQSLDVVSKVGVEFLGIEQGQTSSSSSSTFLSFPNLKQLTIELMDSWQEWEGVEGENSENITIMPCLSHLTIGYCKNIQALPDFLWNTPLQNLEIRNSPILKDLYTQEIGEAKISQIPNIQLIQEVLEDVTCCIC